MCLVQQSGSQLAAAAAAPVQGACLPSVCACTCMRCSHILHCLCQQAAAAPRAGLRLPGHKCKMTPCRCTWPVSLHRPELARWRRRSCVDCLLPSRDSRRRAYEALRQSWRALACAMDSPCAAACNNVALAMNARLGLSRVTAYACLLECVTEMFSFRALGQCHTLHQPAQSTGRGAATDQVPAMPPHTRSPARTHARTGTRLPPRPGCCCRRTHVHLSCAGAASAAQPLVTHARTLAHCPACARRPTGGWSKRCSPAVHSDANATPHWRPATHECGGASMAGEQRGMGMHAHCGERPSCLQ